MTRGVAVCMLGRRLGRWSEGLEVEEGSGPHHNPCGAPVVYECGNANANAEMRMRKCVYECGNVVDEGRHLEE